MLDKLAGIPRSLAANAARGGRIPRDIPRLCVTAISTRVVMKDHVVRLRDGKVMD